MQKKFFKNAIFKPGIKFSSNQLIFLTIVSIVLLFWNVLSIRKAPHAQKQMMIDAANTMVQAEKNIFEFRQQQRIPADPQLDPLLTGFIGGEFSSITTTIGNLDAKQVSVNPDFAALYIRWFNELRLQKGETAVIHVSASFPALSIAAIIACETAGLEPLILSSAGASSFGANIPEMTYWDMENHLFEKGLLKHRTAYASLGGQNDNGSSFWEGGMEAALNSADRNNYQVYVPENLEQAVQQKVNFINSVKAFKLFINIGGNQAALGTGPCSMSIPAGLILEKLDCSSENPGLIHILNQQCIPIIHMLNIKELAAINGISISTDFYEGPGRADVYFIKSRPLWLPALSLILLMIYLGLIHLYNSRSTKLLQPQAQSSPTADGNLS